MFACMHAGKGIQCKSRELALDDSSYRTHTLNLRNAAGIKQIYTLNSQTSPKP